MHKDEALKGLLTEEELAYLLAASPAKSLPEQPTAQQSAESEQQERELRLARHWEMAIGELKREMIELRARVRQLEHELSQTAQTLRQYADLPEALPSRDKRTDDAGTGERSARDDAERPEPGASLSRVERYKAQRGRWF